MSFDINQLGPLGNAARGDASREAETDDKARISGRAASTKGDGNGNGNGNAVHNGNGNGHLSNISATAEIQPLRNGALKREVAVANETVGDLIELTRRLSFEVDETSGAVVVKISDKGTGALLREIPAEEFIQLHERLDGIRFLLVDDVG